MRDLRDDCQKTAYGNNAAVTHHLLVSKSGFTDEVETRAKESERLHLISTDELLGEGQASA